MQSVTVRSHIGSDGMLNLQIPVELKDVDVEVVVTMKPLTVDDLEALAQSNGWPPGFFTNVIGSWEGEPLAREPEGDYEEREELL
ncbi:MAG: hypothetical protein ACREBD_37345 [Blastocatellia bacterium]